MIGTFDVIGSAVDLFGLPTDYIHTNKHLSYGKHFFDTFSIPEKFIDGVHRVDDAFGHQSTRYPG